MKTPQSVGGQRGVPFLPGRTLGDSAQPGPRSGLSQGVMESPWGHCLRLASRESRTAYAPRRPRMQGWAAQHPREESTQAVGAAGILPTGQGSH